MRAGWGLALWFAAALGARSQSVPAAATEISVRLYSTRVVSGVTIVPVEATMRLCARCAETLVPARLEVRAAARRLVVGGRTAEELDLRGHIRVTADDGQVSAGAGRWKIAAAADGLHVVLTIPSERYVMAVLSSEAAAGDSAESLKALAVVARSFALTNAHRHGAEGLCDSTHCQAARVGPVAARIEQAVRETGGETLWWKGSRVAGYFTESCGGMTEDAAELWGGVRRPWLVAHADSYCQRTPSQWHAELSEQELNSALGAEGWKTPAAVDGVRIVERDPSGRVRRVEIAGSGQRVTIGAASLRFAVNRALGWNRLRSDWYDLSYARGRAVFDGKGFGHGVGLCQAGSSEMAREGQGYRAILGFYFRGAEVRVEAGDTGWQVAEGNGWTLRSVGESAAVMAAGDRALGRARGLFPVGAGVRPVVTLYPETELFRQATNEPGWMLGSTRGAEIALQPMAVVVRRGGLEGLLLHEFLHSLVEQEAGDPAPLWLREGLVEALAGGGANGGGMTLARMEEGLRRPKSQEESQRAHGAAGELVRGFVASRGMGVVRGWLRSGVPGGIVAGE